MNQLLKVKSKIHAKNGITTTKKKTFFRRISNAKMLVARDEIANSVNNRNNTKIIASVIFRKTESATLS